MSGPVETAHADARLKAALETALPLERFPTTPPFTLAQAVDDSFWAGDADAANEPDVGDETESYTG